MYTPSTISGYQLEQLVEDAGWKKLYTVWDVKRMKRLSLLFYPSLTERNRKLLQTRIGQLQQLKHSSLLPIVDWGNVSSSSSLYYTYPLLPTSSLATLLSSHSVEEKLFFLSLYLREALKGLGYIHRAGTTHRNLHPESLRITHQRQLFLKGFVHTRSKRESSLLHRRVHFPYLAPEQLLGESSDRKCDLYSLGVICFYCLSGKLPYTSNYEKIQAYDKDTLLPLSSFSPSIPESMRHMIQRALAPRKFRYSLAEEWLEDVEHFYAKCPLSMKWKHVLHKFHVRFFSSSSVVNSL